MPHFEVLFNHRPLIAFLRLFISSRWRRIKKRVWKMFAIWSSRLLKQQSMSKKSLSIQSLWNSKMSLECRVLLYNFFCLLHETRPKRKSIVLCCDIYIRVELHTKYVCGGWPDFMNKKFKFNFDFIKKSRNFGKKNLQQNLFKFPHLVIPKKYFYVSLYRLLMKEWVRERKIMISNS